MLMQNMKAVVGSHDILFITLDTLRYDAAVAEMTKGNLPNLQKAMQGVPWEKRHTPGSFTLPAHMAFFAGFLPTPARPGTFPRLFVVSFPGSVSIGPGTFVFDTPDIVSGLAKEGYHTVCIGGVGFFDKQSPLGHVLPGYFAQSFWSTELGVTARDSTKNQVACARDVIGTLDPKQKLFLFINISALHQPNFFYLDGSGKDTLESHKAALRYVDSQLNDLFQTMRNRRPVFCIVCSDHGTTYGEDGFHGHRIGHDVVWTVPYTDFFLS